MRVPAVIDELCDTFLPFGDTPSTDPLRWPGYADAARRAAQRAGHAESVVTGRATIGGGDAVVVAFDYAFLAGTLGEATGDLIIAAVDRAIAERLPLVSVIATGGARMQEGLRSLVQMQRIAAALAASRRAGVPHVAVLDHPTTGGVWASLGAGADVVLARTGALVAFAGPRLRDDADGDRRAGEFTAAGKVARGFADAEVDGDELAPLLARWVSMLRAATTGSALACEPPAARRPGAAAAGAWAAVEAARAPSRPRAADYLADYFDEHLLLRGDRQGGVDEGVLVGIGRRHGRAIAFAAQQGTPTLPAGYRCATRLLKLAERLRIPVLTLIDTPGAANDADAEAAGVGTAIAELLIAMAELEVPVTSVVIGEGGSGGAMALAAPGRLWMAPDAYFSVIAPELAAEILHRDRGRARELSEHLALTPNDVVRLGVAHDVLHPDMERTRHAHG